MAESDLHWEVTTYCIEALQEWYSARPDVYVAGDNFFYYERGVHNSVVSPDCYVVPGAGAQLRDVYLLWMERGLTPSVAIEITSRSTRETDIVGKKMTYQQMLKIPEYFLIDPTLDYIPELVMGFRLIDGEYQSIDPDSVGHWSNELALYLITTPDGFRFLNPDTGVALPTRLEVQLLRLEAERKAELEHQRAEAEHQRAEAERRRADDAERNAQYQENSRSVMEAEVARLRAEIAAMQRGK